MSLMCLFGRGLRRCFQKDITGLVLGVLAASLMVGCGDSSESPPSPEPVSKADNPMTGIWQATGTEKLVTVDGSAIPFTEVGQRQYDANRQAAAEGNNSWDTTLKCWPPGLPRLMTIPEPIEIIIEDHLVSMTFQYQRLVRFVYIDQSYPTNTDPAFLGESHGEWQDDTLIVTSNKFKPGTVLDATGIPHSDELEVEERFQLTAPDSLQLLVTISDPVMFKQPWQAVIEYQKLQGVQIEEDVCVERQGIFK